MSVLLDIFGSPNAVFEASAAELLSIQTINHKVVEGIQACDLGAVQAQIETWQAGGIQLLTWQDAAYPSPFVSLSDRPPLLFARGKLVLDWSRTIAIVGTRDPDVESHHFAELLGQEMARRGWLVVSGLARGIDAAAHRGALLGGGITVGMLGCGVDTIAPLQNRDLASKMMVGGAIYAEVLPETPPSVGALMTRNRLIAGVAKATFVIQAGEQSGSLEAARRARRGGRHVFTLDHPDYPGNQALLRMEAHPLPPRFADWDQLNERLDHLPNPPKQLGLFEQG